MVEMQGSQAISQHEGLVGGKRSDLCLGEAG